MGERVGHAIQLPRRLPLPIVKDVRQRRLVRDEGQHEAVIVQTATSGVAPGHAFGIYKLQPSRPVGALELPLHGWCRRFARPRDRRQHPLRVPRSHNPMPSRQSQLMYQLHPRADDNPGTAGLGSKTMRPRRSPRPASARAIPDKLQRTQRSSIQRPSRGDHGPVAPDSLDVIFGPVGGPVASPPFPARSEASPPAQIAVAPWGP